MKKFDIITIFPKIFDSYFGESILKRAKEKGAIEIAVHNLRNYSTNKHHNVDDTPYGGGAGMVMQVQPIYDCVNSIKKGCHSRENGNPEQCSDATPWIPDPQSHTQRGKQVRNDKRSGSEKTRVILFSAKGKRYTQEDAKRLAQYDQLIFICGRYEGVDERVAEHVADEELSIGDFVLTGGEIPAMAVVDSIARLLPGVLGNDQSAEIESHSKEGYLEYPQYSKPEEFEGWKVPEILLSGNHGEIRKWREEHSKRGKK